MFNGIKLNAAEAETPMWLRGTGWWRMLEAKSHEVDTCLEAGGAGIALRLRVDTVRSQGSSGLYHSRGRGRADWSCHEEQLVRRVRQTAAAFTPRRT